MALLLLQRSNFDFTGKPDSALDQEQESGPKRSNPIKIIYRKKMAISRGNRVIEKFIDAFAAAALSKQVKDCDAYQCHRMHIWDVL